MELSKPWTVVLPRHAGHRFARERAPIQPPGWWHRVLRWLATVMLAAASVTAMPVPAQDYPTRPVRMIVPFAPGGASDFVGRIIQPSMSELLGQQVVIENRAGAAGNIGVEVAAHATPDGYTFVLGNVGTMAINPNYYTRFPVKPLRDLVPVTQVVDVPDCLVVNPSMPATNIKELIAHLRANPDKINYGSAAPSSNSRLETEMFLLRTGTQATQIPYKGGAGPAIIGLLGNEVQMMFVTISSAMPFVKDGRLRMLAVVSAERLPSVPEVATMREQGIDDVVGSWQGIFLPQGTPANVVERLFTVTQKTMNDPGVQKHLAKGGVEVVLSKSPGDFTAFVQGENGRYAGVIRDAHIATAD
jgi:tripartite-type tricarboxylate transporter receptor subunit TctC